MEAGFAGGKVQFFKNSLPVILDGGHPQTETKGLSMESIRDLIVGARALLCPHGCPQVSGTGRTRTQRMFRAYIKIYDGKRKAACRPGRLVVPGLPRVCR